MLFVNIQRSRKRPQSGSLNLDSNFLGLFNWLQNVISLIYWRFTMFTWELALKISHPWDSTILLLDCFESIISEKYQHFLFVMHLGKGYFDKKKQRESQSSITSLLSSEYFLFFTKIMLNFRHILLFAS